MDQTHPLVLLTKGWFENLVVDEVSYLYYTNKISYWLKKIIFRLVNCVVAIVMSLKIRIHAFVKFYYKSVILL